MFVDLFFDKGLQLRSKLSRGACPQHSRPQVLDILKSELFKLSHLSSNMVFSFECVCVCGGGGGGGGGGKGQGDEWSYHHNGQSNGPFPRP